RCASVPGRTACLRCRSTEFVTSHPAGVLALINGGGHQGSGHEPLPPGSIAPGHAEFKTVGPKQDRRHGVRRAGQAGRVKYFGTRKARSNRQPDTEQTLTQRTKEAKR
ncbi:MAG: hypothetical protein JXA57_05070, partial [Armatimonadetes bacterium]|nr:hypothetical protein [Armatimonadota bacterium]